MVSPTGLTPRDLRLKEDRICLDVENLLRSMVTRARRRHKGAQPAFTDLVGLSQRDPRYEKSEVCWNRNGVGIEGENADFMLCFDERAGASINMM